MVFHQNGSTMTYWADENTNWNVSGVVSNAINPFWIVALSIPLVGVWNWLRKRGLEPSTPDQDGDRDVPHEPGVPRSCSSRRSRGATRLSSPTPRVSSCVDEHREFEAIQNQVSRRSG